MSACCSDGEASKHSGRHRCPVNGREYGRVGIRTLLHHLREPWKHALKTQDYYFCEDPECEVVYFGKDNSTIERSQLRTEPGQKQTAQEGVLCYCFGVTYEEARRDPAIKAYVVEQTRQSMCSCETSNPSGRCCLKDFPK